MMSAKQPGYSFKRLIPSVQAGVIVLLLLVGSIGIPSTTSAVTRIGFLLSHDMYLSDAGNQPREYGGGIEIGFPFGSRHRWAIFGSGYFSSASAGDDADPIAFLACELRYRRYMGSSAGNISPFICFGSGGGLGPFTLAAFVQAEVGAELYRERSFGVELAVRYRPVLTFEPIHSIQAAISLRFGKGRS